MNSIFTYINNAGCINYSEEIFLGHTFGQGHISPDNKVFAVGIPKNASSSGNKFYSYNNFLKSNFNTFTPDEYIVIIRDPVERWISGVIEYLMGNYGKLKFKNICDYLDNKLVKEILFDQVIFDVHTLPQIVYINGLDISKIKFYYQDTDVYDKIAYHQNLDRLPNNFANDKTNLDEYNYIKQLLLGYNKINEIQKMYYCDYQLIDDVSFV